MIIPGQDKNSKWKALKYSHKDKYNTVYYECLCVCGKRSKVRLSTLKNASNGASCGCSKRLKSSYNGKSIQSKIEYNSYKSMIQRCYNKKLKSYKLYGCKGITVCKEWLDSFAQFEKDMGKRPSTKFSIERIDNNGSYCKENCIWATRKQQQNNKSNTLKIEHFGETITLTKACELYGIKRSTLFYRIKKKWDISLLFSRPIRGFNGNQHRARNS